MNIKEVILKRPNKHQRGLEDNDMHYLPGFPQNFPFKITGFFPYRYMYLSFSGKIMSKNVLKYSTKENTTNKK